MTEYSEGYIAGHKKGKSEVIEKVLDIIEEETTEKGFVNLLNIIARIEMMEEGD